jgi:hypothetical protein
MTAVFELKPSTAIATSTTKALRQCRGLFLCFCIGLSSYGRVEAWGGFSLAGKAIPNASPTGQADHAKLTTQSRAHGQLALTGSTVEKHYYYSTCTLATMYICVIKMGRA